MSNNKVLFQVELLPPNQGNLKRVKDIINEVTEAERRSQQVAQKSSRQRQTREVQEYKTELLQLKNVIEENEQATRFNNRGKEETLERLQDNIAAADRLRDKLDTLNVSTAEEAKLRQKANATVKRGHLAYGRIETDFKQMARVGGAANQTLLETGRIVSDLPFGFLGISNNVEAATASFSNLMNKSGGVKGALRDIKTQLLGPSGLVVLFSSVVPAAVTFATIGLRNWGRSAAATEKEQERLSESTKELAKGYKDLFGTTGPDPFGIQEANEAVMELNSLETALEDIFQLQEDIRDAQLSQTMADPMVQQQRGRAVRELESQLEDLQDQFSLTSEEIDDFEESLGNAEETQQKLIDRLALDPLQEFRVEGLLQINEAMDRYNMGLRTTADGSGSLRDQLNTLMSTSKALEDRFQSAIDQGNNDLIPYLRIVQQRIEELEDAFPDAPDKPIIKIAPPEDEVMDNLNTLEQMITDFEDDFDFEHRFFVPDPKDIRKMNERAFKIRQEMLEDSISIHTQFSQQMMDVELDAKEAGIQGHESVERVKTAITERYAHERMQLELERERNLMQAKMGIASEFSNFMSAVNNALHEESLALSLAMLALNKGLAIAEVITEANARAFELNAAADTAFAKGGIMLASGNPQAGAMMGAAAAAKAQAAKVKAHAYTTAGIIAATGLAEGIGQIVGDSGGGDAGASSGSTGRSRSIGFVTDDVEEQDRDNRDRSIPSRLLSQQNQQVVYVNVNNMVDEKGISSLVQKGDRQRRKILKGLKSKQPS